MPLFDQKCKNCHHIFEISLDDSDDPTPPCPQCKHPESTRIISPVGILFKGEGWDASSRRAKTFKHNPYTCVNSDGEPVNSKGELL